MRLPFHVLCRRPHLVDAERSHEPIGLAFVVTAHMLAADQRNGLAEALAMQIDQRAPMSILFLGHVVEHLGRLRIGRPQAIRISPINPAIVLLGRDREREDFLLGQGVEGAAAEAEDAGEHAKFQFRRILNKSFARERQFGPSAVSNAKHKKGRDLRRALFSVL